MVAVMVVRIMVVVMVVMKARGYGGCCDGSDDGTRVMVVAVMVVRVTIFVIVVVKARGMVIFVMIVYYYPRV